MGTTHLQPAMQDLNRLLELEPNNEAAKHEAQKVQAINPYAGLANETINDCSLMFLRFDKP